MSPYYPDHVDPYEIEEFYASMRRRTFGLARDNAGADAGPDAGTVRALFIETGWEDSCYGLVVGHDGAPALYFSTGGRHLGGAKDPQAIEAAKSLVASTESYLEHFRPVSEYLLPEPGRTHFHLIGGGRVLAARFRETDLAQDVAPLSPLYREAEALMSLIRKLTNQPIGDDF